MATRREHTRPRCDARREGFAMTDILTSLLYCIWLAGCLFALILVLMRRDR